jgi:GrxC family glutaredoxin
MPEIVMYSKSWCPYCDRAKRLLAAKGQSWTEIDVEASDAARDEMIRMSGQRTVPQIWIGDRHVGGFDELAVLEDSGELDALLGRAAGGGASEHRKLVIVGGGPAGFTAAL